VCISPFFLHISQVMSWKGSRLKRWTLQTSEKRSINI
jgi:hypothetical protein